MMLSVYVVAKLPRRDFDTTESGLRPHTLGELLVAVVILFQDELVISHRCCCLRYLWSREQLVHMHISVVWHSQH